LKAAAVSIAAYQTMSRAAGSERPRGILLFVELGLCAQHVLLAMQRESGPDQSDLDRWLVKWALVGSNLCFGTGSKRSAENNPYRAGIDPLCMFMYK